MAAGCRVLYTDCIILPGAYIDHVEPCTLAGQVTHISDGKPVSDYVARAARNGEYAVAWEASSRR